MAVWEKYLLMGIMVAGGAQDFLQSGTQMQLVELLSQLQRPWLNHVLRHLAMEFAHFLCDLVRFPPGAPISSHISHTSGVGWLIVALSYSFYG